MAIKIAVILCLFSLARAGNLYGGSGLGYSSGLGYGTNLGHGTALGYGASLGYRSGYASGLRYGSNIRYSSLDLTGLRYSSLNHGSSYSGWGTGTGRGYNGLAPQGYGGFGASAYADPAISTVSHYSVHSSPVVKTYPASAASYSEYGARGAYAPGIDGTYGYGAYGSYGAYFPAVSGVYGNSEYRAPGGYSTAFQGSHGLSARAYSSKW